MNLMPTLFVSHGAPTFALEPGELGPRLTQLGQTLPRPAAVLVVSPHWMTDDVYVTAAPAPVTMHDFGGFAPALYSLRYPAPGAPALAAEVADMLTRAGWPTALDMRRGYDHGAWVPLRHLYPEADVPMIQVAMPAAADADATYALGAALAPLRGRNVLIVGSGSLTHNLSEYRHSSVDGEAAYARQCADWARHTVTSHNHARLRRTMRWCTLLRMLWLQEKPAC